AATLPSTFLSIEAYGRDAIVRSCARRSFAAETIFMALVICWVFLTERMRRRISIRLGMRLFQRILGGEPRLKLLDRLFDPAFQVRVQRLFCPDVVQHLRVR